MTTVKFSKKLADRTIAFCKDELNYHIRESGCAKEYHEETLAEIELLFRLGEKESAEEYKNQYLEELEDEKDVPYYHPKDIEQQKVKMIKFWDLLTFGNL